MHANKQLVNSENWTLNYSVSKTNNMFPFPTKTRGELAHRLTLVSPRFFFFPPFYYLIEFGVSATAGFSLFTWDLKDI